MCRRRCLGSVGVWVGVPSSGTTGTDLHSSSLPNRTSTMVSMWPSTGEDLIYC